MWDIFVSYVSEDSDVTTQLVKSCMDLGLTVWHDEFEIKPGDNIKNKIIDGLQQTKAFVPIISSNYLKSDWAKREFYPALSRTILGNIRFFPVLHNISRDEIMYQSPLLADIVAVNLNEGIKTVTKKIYKALAYPKNTNKDILEKKVDDKGFINTDFDAFISYYEINGKKYATLAYTILLDKKIKPFVAHIERPKHSEDFDEKRKRILHNCKYFIFINTMEALKRDEIIKEFKIAYPLGNVIKPKLLIYRHNIQYVPRTDPEFEKATGIENFKIINQHDFCDEDDLATALMISCIEELK